MSSRLAIRNDHPWHAGNPCCGCWSANPSLRTLSRKRVDSLVAAICSGRPERALEAATEFRDATAACGGLLRDAHIALNAVFLVGRAAFISEPAGWKPAHSYDSDGDFVPDLAPDSCDWCHCGSSVLGRPLELAIFALRRTTADELLGVCDLLVESGAKFERLAPRRTEWLLSLGSYAAGLACLRRYRARDIEPLGLLLDLADLGFSPSKDRRHVLRALEGLAWQYQIAPTGLRRLAEEAARLPPGLWLELLRAVSGPRADPPESLVVHENLRLHSFRILSEVFWPEWRGSTLWWFDGLRAAWIGAAVRAGIRRKK